jgi:hypothetical protein
MESGRPFVGWLLWHIVALAITLLGFVVLNMAFALLFPPCIDCHAHVGVPFAYMDTGSEAAGGGLLWRGVVADSLIILATTFGLLSALRHIISGKRS